MSMSFSSEKKVYLVYMYNGGKREFKNINSEPNSEMGSYIYYIIIIVD